jgi:hypothetical protein
MSEGCKPEFWIGRSGGAAKNVRHSVRLSEGCNPSSGKGVWGATKISLFVKCMSADVARQKHLAKAATAAPRRGTYVSVRGPDCLLAW